MLRQEAARAGLDVIAVTNHNQSFTGRLAGRISEAGDGPLMLAGEEITNPQYHMIAVGIERTVRGAQVSAAEAIADVHSQGGVAIAAHPSRAFTGTTTTRSSRRSMARKRCTRMFIATRRFEPIWRLSSNGLAA